MSENDDPDMAYRDMLCTLSSLFIGEKLLWLKFLLYDSLPVWDLDKKDITAIALIDKLDQSGKIKPDDIKLLTEISDLIEIEDVNKLIREYSTTQVSQVNSPVNRPMNAWRRRTALFKAIRECTVADIHSLAFKYKLTSHNFTNGWDLVFHLETHIWPKKPMQTNLKEFAAKINENAQLCLGDGPIQEADDATTTSDVNVNSMSNNPNGSGDVRNSPWKYCSVRCRYVTMKITLAVCFILFITFLVLAVTVEGVFVKIVFVVLAMITTIPFFYQGWKRIKKWYKDHEASNTTQTQSSPEEYNHLST